MNDNLYDLRLAQSRFDELVEARRSRKGRRARSGHLTRVRDDGRPRPTTE